jgi:hypothetical protein
VVFLTLTTRKVKLSRANLLNPAENVSRLDQLFVVDMLIAKKQHHVIRPCLTQSFLNIRRHRQSKVYVADFRTN